MAGRRLIAVRPFRPGIHPAAPERGGGRCRAPKRPHAAARPGPGYCPGPRAVWRRLCAGSSGPAHRLARRPPGRTLCRRAEAGGGRDPGLIQSSQGLASSHSLTPTRRRRFMKLHHLLAALALGAMASTTAYAAEPLRIGLVLPMSGVFSGYGKQIEHGVRLYLQQNGDSFEGRKVEIVLKDDTGAAPEISRRLAQELIVRDKVDILAGFAMTPGAVSAAAVATSGD